MIVSKTLTDSSELSAPSRAPLITENVTGRLRMGRGTNAEAVESDRELDLLRQIIVGKDHELVASAIDRTHTLAQKRELVIEVLSETAPGQHLELDAAIRPWIHEGVFQAVMEQPDEFGKAIGPSMGPALRATVKETMATFVRQIDNAIQYSVSPKGLLWRMQAARSGIPFSEMIIRKTLEFAVRDVFLIERESGVLLTSVHRDSEQADKASLVASMMTVLESFAEDAFNSKQSEGVKSFEIGDLTAFSDFRAATILVVVVSGNAADSLRERTRTLHEQIYLRHGKLISKFDGDTESVAPITETMTSGLVDAKIKSANSKSFNWKALGVALLLVFCGLFFYSSVLAGKKQTESRAKRWNSFVNACEAEPGIIISKSEFKEDGKSTLYLMRDSLSPSVKTLSVRYEVDLEHVVVRETPYFSTEPTLGLKRLEKITPDSVTTTVSGSEAFMVGRVSPEEKLSLSSLVPSLFGVTHINTEGLIQTN